MPHSNFAATPDLAPDLALVHAVGLALLQAPSPWQGLHAALDQLEAHFSPDMLLLYSLDANGLAIEISREHAAELGKEVEEPHLLGQCLCGWTAKHNQTLVLDDILLDPRCTRLECKAAGIRAIAVLPLRAGNEIIGLLTLGSLAVGAFAQLDTLLESVASVLALGLRNALLMDNLDARMRELEATSEKAQRSEELFRTIVENAPVMISILDHDRALTFLNKEGVRGLGYALEELQAMDDPMAPFYPDPATHAEMVSNMLKGTGQFFDCELVIKGGEVRQHCWADFKLADGSIVGIGMDVTEERTAQRDLEKARRDLEATVAHRTQALQDMVVHLHQEIEEKEDSQQALHRHAALLDSVISHIPYSIYWKDAELKYLGCNERFAMAAGLSSARDIIGKTDLELPWLPPEANACRSLDREVMTSGEAKLRFVQTLTVGSRTALVEASKAPLRDAEGAVVGVLGIHADITDRVALEDALRASETKFQTLYSSMPDGYLAVDAQGRLLEWNPAFAAMVGYCDAELRCMDTEAITPARWRDLERDIIQDSILGKGQSAYYEKEYIHKDGSAIPVALHSFLLRGKDGAPAAVATVVRDISQQKQLERSILDAKAKAEDDSKAKSDFMARMSHEIRTPMNAILGVTQLAEGSNDIDSCQDALSVVRDAATGLMAVLSDILDISRIESHGLELSPRPTDVGRLIRSLAASLEPLAKEKGIQLRTVMAPPAPDADHTTGQPPKPPSVMVDADRLRQVLFNLTHNAIKFTPHGAVTITLSWEKRLQRSITLTIHVEDTGLGIPQDKLPHIFAPFYQVDGGISRDFGGSGLGLAISNQIVERMGGMLTAHSEPGKGSRFTVSVELQQSSAPPLPENMEKEDKPDSDALPGGVRVLLVEDNSLNALVARSMLERLGCAVMVAENGRQALERANQAIFDLILLDIEMPGMDGLEVTRRLKAGEAGRAAMAVPVIAMTAHAMKGYRELCLEYGMQDYVAKPIDLRVLRRVLQRTLQASGRQGEDANEARFATLTPPGLDIQDALQRLEGDADLLMGVLSALHIELPQRRRALEDAVAAGDLETAAHLAHNLKSALGMAGAARASAAASVLSEAAIAGDKVACQEGLSNLFLTLDAAAPAIRDALARFDYL